MGKMTLTVEVDEALVRDLESRGIDPLRFAEVGFSEAYDHAKRSSLSEKAKDFEGSERRAGEWAEQNKEAIDEFNRHLREHGLLSEHEPFRPRWLR